MLSAMVPLNKKMSCGTIPIARRTSCNLIDGRELRSMRLQDVRRAIGIVPQDIFLFSGTIADNISYFKPEATREEVRAAATAAGADEFIERFPKQYHELMGERGVN